MQGQPAPQEDERRLQTLRADLAEAEAEIARGDYVEWTPELRAGLQREARQMVAEGQQSEPDVCP